MRRFGNFVTSSICFLAFVLLTSFPRGNGSYGQPPVHDVPPAVGINKFDLFKQYLGTTLGDLAGPAYQKVARAMAKKAIEDAANVGITYFRVSATGFQPADYDEVGDLDLWLRDPQAHWELFDEMMGDLEAGGVRIVPVFVWSALQFPAMSGNETITDLIADSTSWSYRMLARYIAEFIQRYRDHPTVYFYELSNELNDHADIDLFDVWCDGTSPCGPVGNFSTDELIAFTGRLTSFIRSLDSTRMISSGFNLPRRAAAHLRKKPGWSTGGADWTPDSQAEFVQHLAEIHADVDIISIHFYNSIEDTLRPDTRRGNVRWGLQGATNVEVLEVVKQVADSLAKLLFVGEFADAEPPILYDRTAPFSQAVLKKIVELEIPFSAPWIWQFYKYEPYIFTDASIEPGYTDFFIEKIKEANRLLGNVVPEPAVPDLTPPQVVLVWPLEDTVLDAVVLVAAVASDDHGVMKVEFWVDDRLRQTIYAPPYGFLFDPSELTPGEHVFKAVAWDAAGNRAAYTTVARRPGMAAPRLSSPVDGSSGVTPTPTWVWQSSDGADSYRLQLATDADFSALILDRDGLTDTTYTLQDSLRYGLYYWRVQAIGSAWKSTWSDTWQFAVGDVTSVTRQGTTPPEHFRLRQNYPNPFNPTTQIAFDLPRPAEVTLTVYDVLGRKVATLVSGYLPAGRYRLPFQANHLAGGVYFYELRAGNVKQIRRMLLVR